MIWNIITDSSCDFRSFKTTCGEDVIEYDSVPFIITSKGVDFVDNEGLNIEALLQSMESDKKVSFSSCPSPATYYDLFNRPGNVIAITISKELSGSYNSAIAAREMLLEKEPEKKIAIINSLSAGAGLMLILKGIIKSVESGLDFDIVVKNASSDATLSRTVFALCSFDNLVKNGRMAPIVGFLAGKLKFWGIGVASDIGTIEIKGKTRGVKKAISMISEDMSEYGKPLSYVAISHCQNPEMVELISNILKERYPNAQIDVCHTRGLCSYYAERHGIIIAYK